MVVIRLMRMGAKKKPHYRIVVQERKKRKEGKYLDLLGFYNPLTKPKTVKISQEKLTQWLQQGAKMSPTVARLFHTSSGGTYERA